MKVELGGFWGLLFIVLLVLKLTAVIDWSWWWVMAPWWIRASASPLTKRKPSALSTSSLVFCCWGR